MKELIRKILLSELEIPNPVHGAPRSEKFSSGWGAKRSGGRPHKGVDIAVSCGTPLIAPADGKVIESGINDDGCGGRMVIDHNGYYTIYCHLQSVSSVNQKIFKGEQIGVTGGEPGTKGAGTSSSGCHLHMEVQLQRGTSVNPESIIKLNSSPKRTEKIEEYGVGTTHQSVKYLKCVLKNTKYGLGLNFDGTEDDYFDENTSKALKKLQKDLEIEETGKIDNTLIPLIKDKIQSLNPATKALIKRCIDS
jgi:hypothetical protein